LDTHALRLLSIAAGHTATTVLVLAHRNDRAGLSVKTTGASRRVGGIGGGVGAFAGSTLPQASIPVGVTGLGLYLFGTTVAVADVSPVSDGRQTRPPRPPG
jgi:hypothetical protein